MDKAWQGERDISIMVQPHGEGNRGWAWQADRVIPSASTIKMVIMAAAYASGEDLKDIRKRVSPGNRVAYSLSCEMDQSTYSLRDLTYLMMVVSDNAAANELIDWLGFDRINAFARRSGLQETRLQRKFMDLEAKRRGVDNTTSVRDLCRLLETIRQGDLEGSDEMMKMLENNRDRTMMGRYLPEDLYLAHKTGLNHDCVIDAGLDEKRTLAIAVFGDGCEVTGSERIGRLYREIREGKYD